LATTLVVYGASYWIAPVYVVYAPKDADALKAAGVRTSIFAGCDVLLPVWVTGYQYKEGRYPVIVNGQSGQVHGRLPMGRLGRFLTRLGEP